MGFRLISGVVAFMIALFIHKPPVQISSNHKLIIVKKFLSLFILPLLLVFLSHTRVMAQNWDINLLKDINPRYPNSSYWQNTSKSAYYVTGAVTLGTLLTGLASDNDDIKHHAYESLLNLGISTALTFGLKSAINRERPADRYPGDVFVNSPLHGKSFPSGHTSLAFSTATTLSIAYKKWYITIPAYLWASSVGYSRMYLGRHYPSDVLGGAAVGIGSGYLTHWLNRQIFKGYYSKKGSPPQNPLL
jgi:membrane-associated phospholipid phosphatase